MSIIEGIGDEVTQFFVSVVVILIVIIAWSTTDIQRQWNIRTVILLDRRQVLARRVRAQRLTNHMESATISEGSEPAENTTSTVQEVEEEASSPLPEEKPVAPQTSDSSGNRSEQEQEIAEEQIEIVRAMDGDSADGLRQRRLAFFQNDRLRLSDLLDDSQTTVTENNATRTPPNTPSAPLEEPETPANSCEPLNHQDSSITIKLKYINDDLKIVDGRLEELLGDFKRRHFEMELSTNKLVRLIFNGQVLQRDSETLQSYGMFNNCVVHCLVHQQRNSPFESSTSSGNNNNNNNNDDNREWDLGNLLVGLVSLFLGAAWYCRYQYPQLFTVTATVGLVTLTGLCTLGGVVLYYPEQMARHRQNQQRMGAG